MTISEHYLSVLANISSNAPLALDPLVFDAPKKHTQSPAQGGALPPSSDLWEQPESLASFIGIRIKAPIEDEYAMASRLAAAAIERQIVPILLSHQSSCGLQRFGFRVEHISGATQAERDLCEEQIKRFWNLAIIVDTSDVALLG